MEFLDPNSLKVENGVQLFKQHIQKRLEPLENHRVGKVMDTFIFAFSRKADENIADYDDRFHKELREVEKVSGTLPRLGRRASIFAR